LFYVPETFALEYDKPFWSGDSEDVMEWCMTSENRGIDTIENPYQRQGYELGCLAFTIALFNSKDCDEDIDCASEQCFTISNDASRKLKDACERINSLSDEKSISISITQCIPFDLGLISGCVEAKSQIMDRGYYDE